MSKENEARTYHFSGENLPHLRGIHGLIYSPLRHKNPVSSFPIYPSFNGIKVDVKEVLLPDYCKSDLVHRALASLEKNPKQDALVAALKDYVKKREKPIEFKIDAFSFFQILHISSLFSLFISLLIRVVSVHSYIATAVTLGISAGSVMLLTYIASFLLAAIAAIAIPWIIIKLLNRNSFNPEQHQVFEKKLEELLESPCINEEKEKSGNLNTAERIAINTKRPSHHRVHFFSPANEDENVTIQPLSTSVLTPMPLR